MLHKFFRRRTKSTPRPTRARRPALEVLEDRCVPDASQVIALPPGQNVFQFLHSFFQNAESTRNQINNAITADEQQTTTQLQNSISVGDQISQALHGQVVQDQQKLASDAASGASPQQQGADLLKAVQDQQIAQAGDAATARFKEAQTAQATQKLQADEQLKAAVNQVVDQAEASVQDQIVNLATGGTGTGNAAVGSPLTAGQTAKYSGMFTIVAPGGGVNVNTQVSLGVTVVVGSNGTTLSGPAAETINVFQGGTAVQTTSSTSGSISGSLKAANNTAASGQFTFTLPDPNTGIPTQAPPASWTGNLGTLKFVGTVTDPGTGAQSQFSLDRVQ